MRIPLFAACVGVLALIAQAGGAAFAAVRPANAAVTSASTPKFAVVYNFTGGADGAEPNAGLAFANGMLIGTTNFAGILSGCADFGCGTVFGVTPAGRETTLHQFDGTPDGAGANGSLIVMGGALYGTTSFGGTSGFGTVFITRAAGTRIRYDFAGGSDGSGPDGGLIDEGGIFYGTTLTGGSKNDGTLFAIAASGQKRIVHDFTGGSTDGALPFGLISGGGELYVITDQEVVAVDGAGNTRVVHRFAAPYFPSFLTYANGLIYGGTLGGGRGCAGGGCGVIFSLTPSGTYRTVYAFGGGHDGANPTALLAVGGRFYGTTGSGGGSGCGGSGCGTVFSLDPATGTETILHRFQLQTDGGGPKSVNAYNGVLYGTTFIGGSGRCSYDPLGGCGTVFALAP